MAIVLSSPENINFLFFLVKLAIAIGAIAILLLLVFWLRLKNIEKRMYFKRRSLTPRLNSPLAPRLKRSQPKKQSLVTTQVKTQITTQAGSQRQTSNLVTNHRRSPIKPSKRNDHSLFPWLLAIAIASITGIAIAVMQLANSLISPEISTFIWFFIGVMLIVSASFIKVA
jgi:hypothetical protein